MCAECCLELLTGQGLNFERCGRSLGDPQFKRGKGENTVECMPDVRRIELQPGDTALVLASDGLWDKVSDTTVVAVLDKVRLQPGNGRKRLECSLCLAVPCSTVRALNAYRVSFLLFAVHAWMPVNLSVLALRSACLQCPFHLSEH